jgi:hypothetical protein
MIAGGDHASPLVAALSRNYFELRSSYLSMAHMLMFGETLHFAVQLNFQTMLVSIPSSFYSDMAHM